MTMSTPVPITERLAHRRRKETHSSSDEFVVCDFILGSVPEVERLWILAKYRVTGHCRLMTPQLFEAFLFLKMNHRSSEAIGGACFERAKAGMDAHELFAELEGENIA